jgi:hypothetical protein
VILQFTRSLSLMSLRTSKIIVGAAIPLLAASLCLADTTTATKHKAPKRKVSHSTTAHKATAHKAPAHKSASKGPKRAGKKSTKKHARGQQVIDDQRAQQIQEALIREHYLKGEPSGTWDTATQQALQRYQADQGWQSKTVPDSRALIRLGLGPDHDHLLNPQSAMTTMPALPPARTRTTGSVTSGASGNSSSITAHSSGGVAVPATSVPELSPSR